ncbi:Hypothetical protein ETEE_0932 [Edwardsiella anguillarum ET080813]|uniref:Uncharacterized protein n=1 Tax=Edwardsiella anguillarum ET080813 TaxID=667120 RepID=A0A076LNZ9_9GAMM|nr:Hypothetical protein ETEE_0932 [Edwardsiella anguillarum ET080813]
MFTETIRNRLLGFFAAMWWLDENCLLYFIWNKKIILFVKCDAMH